MSGAASRRSLRATTNGRRESSSVRALRRLRSTSRFRREIDTILSSIRNSFYGVRGGSLPNYYEQLVESLDLPDRPELTKFERALPGEASAIRTVARIAASTVINNYRDVRKADPAAKAMRDQHAKPHACLRARFIVNDKLPAGFEVGVFRPNHTYEARVRFSNASGNRESDRKGDGRGMAIKLLNVSGCSFLSTRVAGWPDGEHDFLMTNHPVFFCKDVADYSALMSVTMSADDSFIARMKVALRFITFFSRRPRQALIFFKHLREKVSSPLRATYHSMTPYQLGSDKVVRYKVTPLDTPRAVISPGSVRRPENCLHDALLAELDPSLHDVGEKAVFDFSVQLRDAVTPDDVEDASRLWNRRSDETISLARIEIPVQTFDRSDQLAACEDMSFNPWNSLPEHRPLGGLNRMRLAVYLASLQVRRRLNLVVTGADVPVASVGT